MHLTERYTEVSPSSLSLCLRTSLNPFICLSSPRGACVCFHVCVRRPRLAQSPHRRRRSGLPLSPRHPAHQESGAFRLQKMLKQPPLTSPFFAGHQGMGGAGRGHACSAPALYQFRAGAVETLAPADMQCVL